MVSDTVSKIFPSNIRILAQSLLGDKSPITENSFSPRELNSLRDLAYLSRYRDGNDIQYYDYNMYFDEKYPYNPGAPWENTLLDNYKWSIQDPVFSMMGTIGRANLINKNGNTYIKDRYNFNGSFDNERDEWSKGFRTLHDIAQKLAPDREVLINLGRIK